MQVRRVLAAEAGQPEAADPGGDAGRQGGQHLGRQGERGGRGGWDHLHEALNPVDPRVSPVHFGAVNISTKVASKSYIFFRSVTPFNFTIRVSIIFNIVIVVFSRLFL